MLAFLIATAIYSSLDPTSLSQQLAYYELYPDTAEGQKCLKRAATLLGQDPGNAFFLPNLSLIVERFTKPYVALDSALSDSELELIDYLAAGLAHRKLKGHDVWTVKEVLALDPEEVDLSRGLLLTFLGEDERTQIRSYEALLDLMALQIRAREGVDPIHAINQLLFFDIGLRFPPQSRFEEEIDAYTFLPTVLDGRRGVCLGVSSLYLCLAQRLNLKLEAVTPPGHIYVRHPTETGMVNIETTARGVHIPSEEYLGLDTDTLPVRNLKEVIGLTFMNQGAALWQAKKTQEAIIAYRQALAFLPEEPLVKEFLSYNLLAAKQSEEAQKLLEVVQGESKSVQDLLDGNADLEAIEAAYQTMGTTRACILAKKEALELALSRHPKFRAGWFHLALTWLELGRQHEALLALERYHALDASDPIVEYLLAAISLQRHDLPRAWRHLEQAETLATNPRPIKELRRALKLLCPSPPLVE